MPWRGSFGRILTMQLELPKTFTYSSHLLTDLTKKTVPWKPTPEHEAQFRDIKEKLSSLRLLGTPASDGEFVVITDASLVGGGGTLLQWQ